MSNKNKKRILSIALIMALLAIVMAGGSLAWFTAEDSATNTFTVGSIEIIQKEQEYIRDENGDRTEDLKEFDDTPGSKVLLPVVNTENPYEDPSYQDKIVTVESTGKNDAYVRTHIAVPTKLLDYLHLDVECVTNGWKPVTLENNTVEVDGVAYTVFSYNYQNKLTKEAPETPVLLKGVYMDAAVDLQLNEESGVREFCKANAAGGFDYSGFDVNKATQIHVLVVSQAVQADGFENADSALESAFGMNVPEFANVKP